MLLPLLHNSSAFQQQPEEEEEDEKEEEEDEPRMNFGISSPINTVKVGKPN